MELMLQLIVLALVVESVWETLKLVYDKDKLSKSAIGALCTGLVVALSVNMDVLKILGFAPVVPYVGVILTGILVSRGSNFIHELYSKYLKVKKGDTPDGNS